MKSHETIVERLQHILGRLSPSESTRGLALAIAVGVAAGLGTVAFRWMIKGFQWVFFAKGAEAFSALGNYYVIILPIIGGLALAPIIYFLAREAKGDGSPNVIKAVVVGGGRIRARVGAVTALASSICIGSGGSVGREGPVISIGASAGSAVGRWFKLPDEWVKTLVLCGAAGGVAATFNAPLGGVFFALEVISRRVTTRRLFNVVVSAIAASYISWIFLGANPSFTVKQYTFGNYWEIVPYIILGLLAGLLAVGFARFFWGIERFFNSVKVPALLKPALGGIAIGAMGYYYSGIFGVGYGGSYGMGGVFFNSGPVDKMLAGQIALGVLIALLFLKIIATSVSLGSGGSGGVFAPSLFIGAALGGVFALLAGRLFPSLISNTGAYSLIGMAAFFAAAVHGPITAIVLLVEMTRDIQLLLPLMTAVVVAMLTARAFSKYSIYTLILQQSGVDIHEEEVVPLMKTITVEEAMTRDFPTVPHTMPVNELVTKLAETGHHGFPVVDEDGHLLGVVTLTDVEASRHSKIPNLMVSDIATKSPMVAYPDQSVYDALMKLGAKDVGRIPVVDRQDRTRLLGVLRRHDIINAYKKRVAGDIPSE